MVFSSIVFLLGAEQVADRLIQPIRFNRAKQHIAAIPCVVFVATQMGANVFSYLRYYSMPPGKVNLVVYFGGLMALLDLFE